jgi:hypothetical protein
MSEKKPVPNVVEPHTKKCPICGKASYSRGGIHPQCAMAEGDRPRILKLAEQRKAAAENKAEALASSKPRSWEKVCPKCQARVPANRTHCTCGHRFFDE